MLPKRGLRLVFLESFVRPFCSGVQVMFLAAPSVLGRAAVHFGGLVQVSAPLAQTLSSKSHLETTNSWVDEVLCVRGMTATRKKGGSAHCRAAGVPQRLHLSATATCACQDWVTVEMQVLCIAPGQCTPCWMGERWRGWGSAVEDGGCASSHLPVVRWCLLEILNEQLWF